MSKYAPLWEYIAERGECALTFADIERVLGFAVDHAFSNAKKNCANTGIKSANYRLKIRPSSL